MSQSSLIRQVKLPGVWAGMRASFTQRYLTRLARQHLQQGQPQMAVFAFDHVGAAITLWGRYERDELNVLMASIDPLLAPGGVCLDIGANIGNHAVFFADHFADVFAFEPNPRTFSLLKINAHLRHNIHCFNIGLSSANRQAVLSVPLDNIGMASLREQPASGDQTAQCELRTLDSLPALNGRRVSLVKIDVEGHETEALRGAQQMLQRDQPLVVFEQAEADFVDGSSSAIDLLRSLGYARFWTLERYPASGSRIVNLLRRVLFGEGFRVVECERFAHRFHSMIVAIPPRQG